jgi:hypothetical protein
MSDKSRDNNFKANKTDILASIAKSAVGVVPFAGTFLTEIVDNIIPNQRFERLTAYVKELDEKISKIPSKKIEILLDNEVFTDLVEESFFQASRVLTKDRRNYIINIVTNGITNSNIQLEDSKFLLKILQELNNIEIIWLRFFLIPTVTGDIEFREKHKNILEPIHSFIGADKEVLNKSAIQKSYRLHLERLGLIINHLKIDKKTGQPELDRSSGQPKIRYTRITPLGEMLLENIGLKKND